VASWNYWSGTHEKSLGTASPTKRGRFLSAPFASALLPDTQPPPAPRKNRCVIAPDDFALAILLNTAKTVAYTEMAC
jgi:hypothetical protein